ncbi:GIY-YIG nuclease family protein [Bacillus sp. C30]|uniref:GIY-YIG nuclease family protein n=1 Tax=Bacillus sp. C30 TaxID=1387733 RepID=UPI00349F56AF
MNMIDIDINIESFRNKFKKSKNELLNLIPLSVKVSSFEQKNICKQNNYDLYYLWDRDSIYRDNLSYQDLMLSTILKNKQMIEFRKEQYKVLTEELDHLKEMVCSHMDLLEQSIKGENEIKSIEILLRNTSLLTFDHDFEEIQPLTSPKGYIYLIKEYHTGTYKIGRTSNPKNRFDVFKVKLPFKWDLVALYKTDNMIELESNLHEVFMTKRTNGEWFNLDEDDLLLLFEIMTNYNVSESQYTYKKLDVVIKDAERNFKHENELEYVFGNSAPNINRLVSQKISDEKSTDGSF